MWVGGFCIFVVDYDTKTRKYRHQEYAGRIAAVQDCLCALVQRFCLNAECLNWGACGGISRSGFCRWVSGCDRAGGR